MHVLWIIGNGFDCNLGLKTSYKDFCEEVYFKEARFAADRAKLSRLRDGSFNDESLMWSDLETLLGKSTVLFENAEADEFHNLFERMSIALRAYLIDQQDSFFDTFQQRKLIDEFWDSIVGFESRLPELDKDQLGTIRNKSEGIQYDFVSLNYTSCFDEMLKEAKKAHNPFDRRGNYSSSASTVLHIHGTLGDGGAIAFGVSDQSQIANPAFAEDEEFSEIWVKRKRNEFYRNKRTQRLMTLIGQAQIICAFGVSMGDTDSYIWKAIGNRIAGLGAARFVLFDFKAEPPGSLLCRKAQKARNAAVANVGKQFGWDEQKVSTLKDRLLILPSSTIFRFPSEEEDA